VLLVRSWNACLTSASIQASLLYEANATLGDAAAHLGNLKTLLDRVHALGASDPSHDQSRVLSTTCDDAAVPARMGNYRAEPASQLCQRR
jgi:hypothetical protein